MRHALAATFLFSLLATPARPESAAATATANPAANDAAPAADPATSPADKSVAANRKLPGRSFKVTVTPDAAATKAGESVFDDALIFAPTTVTMTECLKVGFGPSPYTETSAAAGRVDFATTQTSETEGTASWNGRLDTVSTAAGPAILSGAMTWTKKDGTVLHYTFAGSESK